VAEALSELSEAGIMERPMECQWIPAAELPRTTLLYKTFLNDFCKLADFYAHPPTLEGILRGAEQVRLDDSVRRGVAAVLRQQNISFGCDDATLKNLDRLTSGAVAIATGQQVGLFGGPSFSVYKALTAIHIAKELTDRGVDAVPVFWLATEDHDLAEVNHCFFGARGGPQRFDLATPGPESRRVGEIPLGEAVTELAQRAAEILEGPAAVEAAHCLTETYRPEETFGSAFAKLMTKMFAGRGLIFLDPLSPELHRYAAGTMRRALEEHQLITKELLARSNALEQAGYHAQVKVSERNTLVFRIVDGQRLPMRVKDGGFVSGKKQESFAEALKLAEEHPEEFSASVLLRPVIQDALLPTAAHIGGPAEVAYFAQATVVHERLLGRAPAVLPRAAFMLVNGTVANLLRKYKLDVRDVLAGQHQLRAKLEAEDLPKTLSRRFAAGEKKLQQVLESLREPLGKLDQTLLGALDNAAEKILYQFNSVRGKASRAEGFRTGVIDGHEREILGLLLPNGDLQERSLCFLPFLSSVGRELLDELDRLVRIGNGDHGVVYL
jgi:bacillithiol biosynthesis cysteine-adding enzyme BshC